MKFTYANVMSTIAMFAAVTTGSSYAAATLAANSVTTKQIKNGQVALADLAPGVRAKLNGASGGGGNTAKPPTGTLLPVGQWADTGAMFGSVWLADFRSDAPQKAISQMIGTTGNVEFRLTGSLTKPAGNTAHVVVKFPKATGQTATIDPEKVGGTFDGSGISFGMTTFTVPAANAAWVTAEYNGEGATSTLRLQVRRVA